MISETDRTVNSSYSIISGSHRLLSGARMETNYGAVGFEFNNGALTCAAETLAALLVLALVRSRLLVLDYIGLLQISTSAKLKGDNSQCQEKVFDAVGDDGGDDNDGDGGFEEGEGVAADI